MGIRFKWLWNILPTLFPTRVHRMARPRACECLLLSVFILIAIGSDAYNVGITFVENAVQKGAVCLDGSPPAYHLSRGFGAGINNWLLHFEGGGWCNNATTCLARRDTRLGSSKKMKTEYTFSGMLANKASLNPDFYNWNKVKVRYCDGSSYTGDVEQVNPATKLYYRGARVFRAIIDDLLAKGMTNAENVLLGGCSAGGLGVILQCDNFRSLMPMKTKVKCFSDAGYFLDAKTISGTEHIKGFYDQVVATHGSAKNLPPSCTSRLTPGLCFFPQYMVQQVRTPLFLLNAAYDSWQIKNILAPGVADTHGQWRDCKQDIKKCSTSQLQVMQDYRLQFLKALDPVGNSPDRGMFINSCYAHCQSGMQETWLRSDSPVLLKTTIAKAVGDWYFARNSFKAIDCPYPCDSSCHNRIFDPAELPN